MIVPRKTPLFCQGLSGLLSLFLLLSIFWERGGLALSQAVAQEKLLRPPVNLHGVSFLTKEEGWAAGQLGKIFHTTDRGQSWEVQRSGTNRLLTAVDFVDRTHGWVVGERGVILHSEDGGATWNEQQSGVAYPLFDVDFIDRKKGWAVGNWGTILCTADGGKHWEERPLSLELGERGIIEPATLRNVTDPGTGEVVVRAGELLTKELIAEIARRGISGVRIREDVVLNAVFFLDHLHGWIAGERGLVLRTENGGETWERVVLPRLPKQGEATTDEEQMSEEELAAFGVVAPPPSLYGIFFVSLLQGWVVGQEGAIARTEDGGRHWEFQPSDTEESLYDIGVVGGKGWIVGDKSTVLVSTNSGLRWKKKDLGLEYRPYWLGRLAIIPGGHAFLVGADGLVLVSGESPEQEIWVQKPRER